MATQNVFLTPDGREQVLSQLELLRTAGRARVAQYLHEAKESGDVIDNAAYDEGKNEQARREGSILELEQLLANAKRISKIQTDDVTLGSVVHVRNHEDHEYDYPIGGA